MVGFWTSVHDPLQQVFAWMSKIADTDDVILVEKSGKRSFFQFVFPLRIGAMPRAMRVSEKDEETFIVRIPNFMSMHAPLLDPSLWLRVFSSPAIGVWERRSRGQGLAPLRFGLDEDERSQLANIARRSIRAYVLDGQWPATEPTGVPRRFFLKTDLDVALWTNGNVRGSIVLEDVPLAEGVARAAVRACIDQRFKPVSAKELDHLAIEITIMRDLRVTLSPREMQNDLIYGEKGYVLVSGTQRGWFLPEVFNTIKFSNLKDFLSALAKDKAKTDPSLTNSQVSIFEVEDFITLPEKQSSCPLYGPIVIKKRTPDEKSILDMGLKAGDWLLNIQEEDGNFAPIVDPIRKHPPRVDWTRLAFTAWALAEFGISTATPEYVPAAQRSFDYLKRHLFKNRSPFAHTLLVLAYAGQLARVLKDEETFREIATRLITKPGYVAADVVTLAQVASFLKHVASDDAEGVCTILRDRLRKRFERARADAEVMDLSLYAELVRVFEQSDPDFSATVAQWLCSMQLEDGSFPQSTQSSFNYTRGTGKIFEVLALDRESNREALAKSVVWLANMQYDANNLFFVAPERRDILIGGFRHDYQNPDSWIDASGHVLLGASRIIVPPL